MNYLFEIGTEEVPARFLQSLISDLVENVTKRLEKITYHEVETFATYRRLALIIKGLSKEQSSKQEEIKGPPEKVAVNEDGSYTKAGEGFLKKFGATEGVIREGYLYVSFFEKGKLTKDILGKIVVDALSALYLPVAMKWGNETQKFYRPVHWIVSILDDTILPLEFAGIKAGNTTCGHRSFSKGLNINGAELLIDLPGNYENLLLKNNVKASFLKRKEYIKSQLIKVTSNVVLDEVLLNEVCGLVENPVVLQGEFEEEFLQIPDRILITSMQKNQKYFPVIEQGKLTNKFLMVADNVNEKNSKNIIAGNQKVLRARLFDAKFFFEEDTKYDFEHFNNQLKTITFQQKLGSIYEKVARNILVAEFIIKKLKLDSKQRETVLAITGNAKADLATGMVNEFAELQGYVGQQYALKWGIDKNIADSIYEHYLPSFAGDVLPSSLIASIASVSDKIETIVGQFVIGKIPSGSQDPFGLRRQANGIVRIFYERDYFPFSLEELLEATVSLYKNFDLSKDNISKLYDFFEQRIEQYLKDQNVANDVIQTVKSFNILLLKKRLNFISILSASEKRKDVLEAIVRVLNITKDANLGELKVIDPFLFEDASERALFDTFKSLTKIERAWDDCLVQEWKLLAKKISNFFEAVMVMVDDEKIKNNRLSLLHNMRMYFEQFGDLKALQF